MLIASLLYHNCFRKEIESIGFEVNPYDTCVSNRTVNGKQHTFACYVDNSKSIYVDTKVNNDFNKRLEKTYGIDNIRHVEASRGKVHEYLDMALDYTEEGKLKIGMSKYLDATIAGFPQKYQIKKGVFGLIRCSKWTKIKRSWDIIIVKYFILCGEGNVINQTRTCGCTACYFLSSFEIEIT